MKTLQEIESILRDQKPILRQRFKVNLEIVWMTVNMEFPKLRPMMENVLANVDP